MVKVTKVDQNKFTQSSTINMIKNEIDESAHNNIVDEVYK